MRCFQFFLNQGRDDRTVPGLNLSSVDVHLLGIEARTFAKILAFHLEHVRPLQPDIVILEIRSNNLFELGQHPQTVVSIIESFVSMLHEGYNVALYCGMSGYP